MALILTDLFQLNKVFQREITWFGGGYSARRNFGRFSPQRHDHLLDAFTERCC